MVAVLSLARRLWGHGSGVAIIEFAILLPVIVALFLGMFESARIMWIRNSVQSATEQAARYVMANTTATNTEISAIAASYYQDVGSNTADFVVSRETIDEIEYVTISGAYAFDYLSPLFDLGDIVLTGKARVPLVE